MTLTLICPESKNYREPLTKALNHVGITDYQILDPAHDEIPKSFTFVVFIGLLTQDRLEKLNSISQKAWSLAEPDPAAPKIVKQNFLNQLEEIKEYMLCNKDRDTFKRSDVPDILNLQDFLNSKKGQVIEVTLPDRRKLGIYPDGQKLKIIYDIEYHASTVVNMAKLFHLFDASEIIIKEL